MQVRARAQQQCAQKGKSRDAHLRESSTRAIKVQVHACYLAILTCGVYYTRPPGISTSETGSSAVAATAQPRERWDVVLGRLENVFI